MKKRFNFLPYGGREPYAYFGCFADDEPIAAEIVDQLVNRGFRVFNDACESKFALTPSETANGIHDCAGAVVVVSKKSIENLAFRNTINYLLSLRKPLVCVKIGDFDLSYGLEMQLANIPQIAFHSVDETMNELLQCPVLTQDMLGAGMMRREYNRKRNLILFGMITAAVLVFATAAFVVVQKRTSPEYVLRNVDGSEYVNIAKFGDDGIDGMKGKTVGELDLSGGEFTTLTAMKDVFATTVNVSDISIEVPLWPLTLMEGIETVKISQDQRIFAGELCDAGITVVVTH